MYEGSGLREGFLREPYLLLWRLHKRVPQLPGVKTRISENLLISNIFVPIQMYSRPKALCYVIRPLMLQVLGSGPKGVLEGVA